MTEPTIPPALTRSEWKRAASHRRSRAGDGRIAMLDTFWLDKRYDAVMSLANDALPDGDPRKFTGELLYALRECVEDSIYEAGSGRMHFHADALRALDVLRRLLPPD